MKDDNSKSEIPASKVNKEDQTIADAKASKSKAIVSKNKANPKAKSATADEVEVKDTNPNPGSNTNIVSSPGTTAESPKPKLRFGNSIIFTLAVLGILAGLIAAYLFSVQRKAQPPVFKPISSPYDSAIYANGIIESDQPSGENINIYPEVSGPILQVLAKEGQQVAAGTPLFKIDDSLQKANVELATANLKAAQDQYEKRRAAYDIDPKSISKDVLDNAEDAVNQATAALKVASTLLEKYSVQAPINGVVLVVNATAGSYVSSQGNYDTYTQLFAPLVVMGTSQDTMDVRCYVDEILVSRLPSAWHIQAQMSIRGTDVKIPLEFVRIQPYVSPKIELSNERQEQVDLRVLPVIFRFQKQDAPVYPGQLVDVYIGKK